jgi:hypothetical protein
VIATRLASLFQREAAGPPPAVRPLASVPGLASHCRGLAVRAGVDGRDPATFSLFGSAVRAAWTHEVWQDVNVALDVEAAPRTIIDGADFTVCQVAVHDGRLFHGQRFFDDLAQRVLIVNRINLAIPLVTLLRMYKYAARGYAVPARELHRVLDAIRRAPPANLDSAAVLRHGGGVVVP